MTLINAHFKKRRLIRYHPAKYLNLRYGRALRYTLAGLVYPDIVGFWRSHYPQPFLKATYEAVWRAEGAVLDATCRRKLRTPGDVNEWLMRYWQLAEGSFHPASPGGRHYYAIGENTPRAEGAIRGQAYDMICLNDNRAVEDTGPLERLFCDAFESILPDKYRFEK
ncbi:hypothetical protein SDC9_205121 [bioreactor metagenome]|uniref:Stealth protein CR4 conserved region 4 domain-containing protein n=1 Tax=bioreactor metagenome TaxID=1076179 RepID=A0A645J1Z4_9ZZZZ